MNYLVSTFDCVIFHEHKSTIHANVKYNISEIDNHAIIFPSNQGVPFLLDTINPNGNVLKVKSQNDIFYFLFPKGCDKTFVTQFSFGSNHVVLTLTKTLYISIDGVLICEKNVENLQYSHFEIMGDICLIYFNGPRKFISVLNKQKLEYAEYYDECNVSEKEKYFMSKCNDSLNHGYVCHIENNKCETYLVYLDNDELLLKDEFVPFVFLDCVKIKNHIYCNSLLCEGIKLDDITKFEGFFPDFDYYYPITKQKFVLIKKNTLAGICEFIVDNNQISNIIFH